MQQCIIAGVQEWCFSVLTFDVHAQVRLPHTTAGVLKQLAGLRQRRRPSVSCADKMISTSLDEARVRVISYP